MNSTKAAIALVVSVFIAGATTAETQVSSTGWLQVLTIALAAVNPSLVWATSNTKQSQTVSVRDLP